MMSKRKVSRQKKEHLVAIWLPPELLERIDRVVAADDTDRSKFIRSVIREKLANIDNAQPKP